MSFNFVRDFEKGTFRDIDLRAVKVDITKLEVDRGDSPNLSLRLRIVHSGESVVLSRQGAYYGFRAAQGDDPISWSFVWNADGKVTADEATTLEIDSLLKKLLAKSEITSPEEYKPSLFSEFCLRISNFETFRKANARVTAVNLKLQFQDRGTAKPPGA